MTRWHHTWICRFWIKQNSLLFFRVGGQNSAPFATVQPEQLNCRGTEGKRSRIAAEPTQAALQAASGYWPAVGNWNGTESGPISHKRFPLLFIYFFLSCTLDRFVFSFGGGLRVLMRSCFMPVRTRAQTCDFNLQDIKRKLLILLNIFNLWVINRNDLLNVLFLTTLNHFFFRKIICQLAPLRRIHCCKTGVCSTHAVWCCHETMSGWGIEEKPARQWAPLLPWPLSQSPFLLTTKLRHLQCRFLCDFQFASLVVTHKRL